MQLSQLNIYHGSNEKFVSMNDLNTYQKFIQINALVLIK